MKKYLIILLLAVTTNGYAQKKLTFEEADSLSKAGVPIKAKWDSISHKIVYYQTFDTIGTIDSSVLHFIKPLVKAKFDTLLVIMLLADTSERSVDNLNQVYWDIGYEVRETFESFTSYKGVSVHDFDHIDYLDFDKKKLPKNIIVWQSKEF